MAGESRAPRVLIADDNPQGVELLEAYLSETDYEVQTAADGEETLRKVADWQPDLILLDIMMPKLDGIETVRLLKADPELRSVPVILVTAKADTKDVVQGLDAGGDDYLTKPFEHSALLARVRSMLRQKALPDTVQEQASELAQWNAELENRVKAQVDEIARIGRLRRFLPPQVAEMLVASGDQMLQSHRREVTVVFCDLRGFTSFTETSEPEEVMSVLKEYHVCLGELITKHEGTLERFVGDGLLVVFNDPMPVPDHSVRAVRMAIEMRECIQALAQDWRRRGHELGFGIGMARGYATLGSIGFEGRSDYAAIGTVPNLASRLCDEAKPGQILVSEKVLLAVESTVDACLIGELSLKGFHRPVRAFEIHGWLSTRP